MQVGFTRIESASPDVHGEFDLSVRSSPLSTEAIDWLPAHEVRGEGFFLQLDEDRVREWEDRPEVDARAQTLLRGYERWAAGQSRTPPPFPGIRYYLLHALSHGLISAVSLECGYAASAIRERSYCAPRTSSLPMAGILLSTGTSGSEGTLGGLVEQGRRVGSHLQAAWDRALLCSNDPICAMHDPARHAARYLEGAACHGCLFVAEPSCERNNTQLDRALLVPIIGQPDTAFFPKRP